MRILALCFVSALLLPARGFGASDLDVASLRTFLEDYLPEQKLKAAVVGVWIDGEAILLEGFGKSMAGVPAEPAMRFRSGGITLTSLCMILLRAAERGEVSLDDPIAKWMPDLPRSGQVTLRMLANCTAGYPDYVPVDSFLDDFRANVFRTWEPQELIDVALAQPFPYEPGKGWNYSHTNFVLLGQILEKVSGKRLPELFEIEVIEPLGLEGSFFSRNPAIPDPVLHAYSTERDVYEDSTFWSPSWTGASGRMVSTLADCGRIGRALVSGSYLSEASRKEMAAPVTVGLGPNTAERFYGMGIGIVNGWRVQNPNMNGFHSFLGVLDDPEIVIMVTCTIDQGYDGPDAPATALFQAIAPRIAPADTVPEQL